ncbi:putative MFS family arabinose efflux permease [Tamaricihabitans halophyticus]|uniref:Putative MFS family arabinose efflux permease n=1 Tax=Tamaricihabitans halophyticus TaxID=1262583 RepID=A0A4R2R125_9PSEU|nr:MFS transporter [Tamaricihabitans halophyticus]TCP55178.1 putative MFS family arabinose efflux permease [Tamaricihabitans halophyticus]
MSESPAPVALTRHAGFLRFWAGDTASQFGTYTVQAVLPLLAIGSLGASAFELGLLNAASTFAFLLIGLPVGAWLDRLRRRPVMIIADLSRGLLLLSVPVAAWFDALSMTQLLIVALLVGAGTVFFDIAAQPYLANLIHRQQLPDGFAKLESTRSISEMSAPAMGGWLIQFAGAANAVLSTCVGYFASVLFLFRIKHVETVPERQHTGRLRTEIVEGLRFVFTHPTIRPLVATGATANLFESMLGALLALYLVQELGLSAGVVGLVLASGGLGSLLGALTASWWMRTFGQVRTMWLVLVTVQPLMLLLPLAQPEIGVALAFVGYIALIYAVVVYDIAQVSYRQMICPDRLRGRMTATMRFVIWGVLPIGALLGGVVGEWLGVRPAIWISTGGSILSVLWVLCSPLRRMRDVPADATPEPPSTPDPR